MKVLVQGEFQIGSSYRVIGILLYNTLKNNSGTPCINYLKARVQLNLTVAVFEIWDQNS